MTADLKTLFAKLTSFAQKELKFERPPKLFLRKDKKNASIVLGKTAYYDPSKESITIYISNRHPKDVLRSFAHELVHHTQNLRGDLSPEKCGKMTKTYAQDNEHMRNMEKEAYLLGNICFRDWEDSCKLSLTESKLLKENYIVTTRITREDIMKMIKGAILEKTKRAGHQIVGRDVPDDRIKPLEEEEVDEESDPVTEKLDGDEDCDVCPDLKEFTNEPAPEKRDDEEDLNEEGPPKWERKKHDKETCEKVPQLCAYDKDKEVKEEVDFGDGADTVTDAGAEEEEEEEEEDVTTPEGIGKINEARFGRRNTALFERLMQEWIK